MRRENDIHHARPDLSGRVDGVDMSEEPRLEVKPFFELRYSHGSTGVSQ